jgi:hypothetical protein
MIVNRPLTAAQVEAAESAKRKANAVQVNITFNAISKYSPGLKILLPDSIYKAPSIVSCAVVAVLVFEWQTSNNTFLSCSL